MQLEPTQTTHISWRFLDWQVHMVHQRVIVASGFGGLREKKCSQNTEGWASKRLGDLQCTEGLGDMVWPMVGYHWFKYWVIFRRGKLMGWIHSPAHEPSLPLQDIDMKTSPKFASESNSTTAGSAEDEVPLMLGLLLVSIWPTCRSRINNFYIFGHFVLLLILINYLLSCICTCLHIIRTQTLIPQLREKIIWGGWFLGLIYAQISPDGVSDSVFKFRPGPGTRKAYPPNLPNLPWSFS